MCSACRVCPISIEKSIGSEMSLFSIDIPKRAAHCLACQASLISEKEIYSYLLFDSGCSTAVREDFCPHCREPKDPTKQVSFWKTKIPIKKEPVQPVADFEQQGLDFLKEALQKNDFEAHAEACILALYLAHRRVLVARKELLLPPTNSPVILYEVTATLEMLTVPKLKLFELQVDAIQTRLANKFTPLNA